ncbi:MAG: NAD kinase [Alphaproteobacteria bacterium]
MKLAFHASKKPRAQKALEELKSLYKSVDPENADVIVTLGGDGTILRALHTFIDYKAQMFGMNLGTLGFLLNAYKPDDLKTRIEKAQKFIIHPLRMEAIDQDSNRHSELAFNEVSLLRETHSSAKIKVYINDTVRIPELVCDGVMLSTALGSTAYNSSAGGPILPLSANVLALTPISVFRPRRWPGALVHNRSVLKFEVLKAVERQVSVAADSKEVRNVKEVTVREARRISKTILFDPESPLEERIVREQFAD